MTEPIKVYLEEHTPSVVCIPCLLCGNLLKTNYNSRYTTQLYICDECKEAIAYAKQLKAGARCDPLEAILD